MNKVEMKFCQSCGMPLTEDVLGTNADGSKNDDYCMYCYRDGKFLQDCTMDEMIEHFIHVVLLLNDETGNIRHKSMQNILEILSFPH